MLSFTVLWWAEVSISAVDSDVAGLLLWSCGVGSAGVVCVCLRIVVIGTAVVGERGVCVCVCESGDADGVGGRCEPSMVCCGCEQPARRAPESAWQHDMYNGGGFAPAAAAGGRAMSGGGIETGTKLYISNLDYGVSNDDIKVSGVMWWWVWELRV